VGAVRPGLGRPEQQLRHLTAGSNAKGWRVVESFSGQIGRVGGQAMVLFAKETNKFGQDVTSFSVGVASATASAATSSSSPSWATASTSPRAAPPRDWTS
jgi:hypothetical protein